MIGGLSDGGEKMRGQKTWILQIQPSLFKGKKEVLTKIKCPFQEQTMNKP